VLPIEIAGCTEEVRRVGHSIKKKCRWICGGVEHQIKHYKIKQNKNIQDAVYLKSN